MVMYHGELTMMAVRKQKGRYNFRPARIHLPLTYCTRAVCFVFIIFHYSKDSR